MPSFASGARRERYQADPCRTEHVKPCFRGHTQEWCEVSRPMDLTPQTQVKAMSLSNHIWTPESKQTGYFGRFGATSDHTNAELGAARSFHVVHVLPPLSRLPSPNEIVQRVYLTSPLRPVLGRSRKPSSNPPPECQDGATFQGTRLVAQIRNVSRVCVQKTLPNGRGNPQNLAGFLRGLISSPGPVLRKQRRRSGSALFLPGDCG